MGNPICMFLCGDVMTGRGIDQILPHPGDPVLYERYVRDARDYVRLAENVCGPIPRRVNFAYIWGDALSELQWAEPDVRIINLETSITSSEDYWGGKEVLYRMHPGNIGCLTAAKIDCCCLANNHVLDWGYERLLQTLQTLEIAGVAFAGAGRDAAEAARRAVLEVPGAGGVLVYSLGSSTSGIPRKWAATMNRSGVNLLENLSEDVASEVVRDMRAKKRFGDVTVASIHWGGNWGYDVPDEQIDFAHRLVDGGFDVVHGHSSHHVKAIEVFQNHLILYGCGDFLTDYEGIRGYEEFRGNLSLMYLIKVDRDQGQLIEVRLIPLQTRAFQLIRASLANTNWLCRLLNAVGKPFGTSVQLNSGTDMILEWQ